MTRKRNCKLPHPLPESPRQLGRNVGLPLHKGTGFELILLSLKGQCSSAPIWFKSKVNKRIDSELGSDHCCGTLFASHFSLSTEPWPSRCLQFGDEDGGVYKVVIMSVYRAPQSSSKLNIIHMKMKTGDTCHSSSGF